MRVRVEHSISHGVERRAYRERINRLIHLLSDVLVVADYRAAESQGYLRDPDDEPILSTALAAESQVVVSLNIRDFPVGGAVAGVRMVTPADFLRELIARFPDQDLAVRITNGDRYLP